MNWRKIPILLVSIGFITMLAGTIFFIVTMGGLGGLVVIIGAILSIASSVFVDFKKERYA